MNRSFSKNGEADFFNVIAWRSTADFCNKYFRKGQQIGLIGSLQNRSWEDKDGRKCYATDVIAEKVYFADSKKDNKSDGFYPIDDSDELSF